MKIMDEIPAIKRCFTCGRYMTPEQEGDFCSDFCAVLHKKCWCCGIYFAVTQGRDSNYCSETCEKTAGVKQPSEEGYK